MLTVSGTNVSFEKYFPEFCATYSHDTWLHIDQQYWLVEEQIQRLYIMLYV